jgi:hypothetical protein
VTKGQRHIGTKRRSIEKDVNMKPQGEILLSSDSETAAIALEPKTAAGIS